MRREKISIQEGKLINGPTPILDSNGSELFLTYFESIIASRLGKHYMGNSNTITR